MLINKNYHGFKLVDKHEVKEINSLAHVFLHEKTGAKLLYLKNDDDNKVFSVAFRTPPSDSTGVPHIIEHCVLSGSRKYKTKEPFMDMVKGSLKTFINAMTFSDKTIYPVASRNDKDFKNLMDVYLDSVFFPLIHEEKEIFMQEGWHYNIHEKNDPITYNGVVYNEMRGAYSQPTTMLREVIGRSLFPDTTYQYSSGGNPDEIPNLTFEAFKQFHKDFYQPSNAFIYLYGNGDIESYLEHINEDYLDHFGHVHIDTSIDKQKPFEAMNKVTASYGISSEEDDSKKTFLAMNFILGDGKDGKNHMIGDILKEVLVNSAAGPLKKALLDAGIGEDIMCSFGGGLQLYLSVIAKNAEASQQNEFEEIILNTLKKLVEEGIDKNALESAVNIAEYDMREATGFATKGIIYHILSMNSWLYDGHPTHLIAYDDAIKEVREQIQTNYFEGVIEEKLINNSHASLVTLVPENGLNEQKSELVEEELKLFKENLDDTALSLLIEENASLKEKQLSPDSKEALATIPQLHVGDVNKEAEEIPREVIKMDTYEIVKHDIFSNNISYVDFIFDTTMIEQSEIPYVSLLTDLVGQMDTSSMPYGQLNNEIYKLTGGITLSTRNYYNTKTREYYPKIVVSGKSVQDKLEALMTLSNTLMTETQFVDKKRLKELLLRGKSRMEMSINSRGDNFASSRVASYFSEASHYSELLKGFEYYWFLSDIADNFDDKCDLVIDQLTALYKKIFNQNNLYISFTGDEESYQVFEKYHTVALKNIDKKHFESHAYNFELQKKNEGIMSSSNVQYAAQGFNFRDLGYEYSGNMQVLRAILNSEYLHDRIRAKGGAYGCGISFSDSGNVMATSFRDPRLEDTLNVFDETATYIKELSLDQEALTKFVIGAISRLDGAMTSKGKGVLSTANYISGLTQEIIQKDRDDILNVTVDQLISLSKIVQDVMDKKYFCVYGNDVKIKESEQLFDQVKNLNN